jgi:hypothetical protein
LSQSLFQDLFPNIRITPAAQMGSGFPKVPKPFQNNPIPPASPPSPSSTTTCEQGDIVYIVMGKQLMTKSVNLRFANVFVVGDGMMSVDEDEAALQRAALIEVADLYISVDDADLKVRASLKFIFSFIYICSIYVYLLLNCFEFEIFCLPKKADCVNSSHAYNCASL